jgi:NitT/TauT family transport system substrate-binding protein
MNVSRRALTLSLGAAGFALAARSRASSQALRPIGVGKTPPSASGWPTYVALELGFFKRYGLDPTLVIVNSVAGIAQQVLAGSLDLAEVSSTQVVEAVQHGATMRYLCESISTPPYSFLAQKQYKRYADLKGKTIIIGGPADITVVFTQKMLASGGLKMTDVDFTYAGATSDRYAALKSGSVAAAILFPPFAFRAADEGYSLLGTLTSVMPPFPFGGWVATDAYRQSHPDIMIDYAKGYLRAVRWLIDPANRARAVEVLVKQANVSADDAAKSYDLLVVQSKAFSPTGIIAPRSFATVIDALAEIKLIAPPLPNPAMFYDNRFVTQANAQLAREPKT